MKTHLLHGSRNSNFFCALWHGANLGRFIYKDLIGFAGGDFFVAKTEVFKV